MKILERNRKVQFVCVLLASALSAFLLWAAFPPRAEAVNIVVALVPMLLITRICAPRQSAKMWFVCGFLFWFATLKWMIAICANGGPLPLVILGWVGLSALCGGYFALFGFLDALLWRRVSNARHVRVARVAALVVAEPILWAGCEWLRGVLFTGFAWNFLGTALGALPQFALPARFGGVYLVSALIVLVNGVFATLGERMGWNFGFWSRSWVPGARFKERIFDLLETGLPLLVVLGALTMPFVEGGAVVPFRVALIQRNAPCVFNRNHRDNPIRVFGDLMESVAATTPDLVVWAESAMVEFGPVQSNSAKAAASFLLAKAHAPALLAGGDDTAYTAAGLQQSYNAAALYVVDTNDVSVSVYHKVHLVPFGEYIPFDKWLTPLQKLSPIGVSLYPGETKLLYLPLPALEDTIALAPLICYEDTDPRLSRAAAEAGAEAIVLITNDSWFAHSIEAEQHAAQAVLRAIETGLPVVRVGNGGVTGVIDSLGKARWLSRVGDGVRAGGPLVDAAATQVETVFAKRGGRKTPYVRYGDAPLLILFGLVLLTIFGLQLRRKVAT